MKTVIKHRFFHKTLLSLRYQTKIYTGFGTDSFDRQQLCKGSGKIVSDQNMSRRIVFQSDKNDLILWQ